MQFIGRSFEITFVEHQVQNGAGMPKPTDVPGISFATPIDHKQKNRIALTFRPGNNIDYEAERNFGTIFQRDPGRNHSTPIHLLSGASGRIGDWLDMPNPYTANNVRISIDGNHILVSSRTTNFTKTLSITFEGKSCSTSITYKLNPGETGFEVFNMRTKVPHKLGSLSAESISCRIGTANLF